MMIEIAARKYSDEMEFTMSLEARLCAIVLNANGAKKKDKRAFEAADFLPPQKKKKKQVPTIEQYQEMMKVAVLKMGGTVST
jgi:hypothetical protein